MCISLALITILCVAIYSLKLFIDKETDRWITTSNRGHYFLRIHVS